MLFCGDKENFKWAMSGRLSDQLQDRPFPSFLEFPAAGCQPPADRREPSHMLLDHFPMLPQVGFGKDHLDQSVNQQWAAYYKLQDRPFLQRVAKLLLQTKLEH